MTTLSDNSLLEQAQQGSTLSFEALFHRHYDRVYGLLFRLVGNRAEAEDLTQEVFLKLHDHVSGRRRRLNAQREEHNLSAWLYRVATNTGYNAIRSRKRRWQRNTLLVPDPTGEPGPAGSLERQEEKTAVRQALSQLKERDVQLLLMRQMGFSYAECAVAVNVSPSSVGTLINRAATAFKKQYESQNGEGQS